MTSFVEVGSGTVVQPSPTTYTTFALTANTELVWPFQNTGQNIVSAMYIKVTGVASMGLVVMLPPANDVSVGASIIFQNSGANTFSVVDNAAGSVVSVAAGARVFVIVSDNTTAAGAWEVTAFGAGSSAAESAALAGLGLISLNAELNTNSPVVLLTNPTAPVVTWRGSTLVWNGGSDTQTIPPPGATGAGDGFWFNLSNISVAGVLTVTVSGGGLINGVGSLTLLPGHSCTLVSNGSAYYTVGTTPASNPVENVVTVNQMDLSVTGNVTLTSQQAASFIQIFTGELSTSVTVTVPNISTVYFVQNQTTSGMGGPYVVQFRDSIATSTLNNGDVAIYSQAGIAGSLVQYVVNP